MKLISYTLPLIYMTSANAIEYEENTDYWGNDISSTHRQSPDECFGDCELLPNCRLYVWFDSTCWLKSAARERSYIVGAKAAFVRSEPPVDRPTLKFVNNCEHRVELHKVEEHLCGLDYGEMCEHTLNNYEHPMFRHSNSAVATLVEITKMPDRIWYDVSVVPPNCGNGRSREECLANNGGVIGYNIPLSVAPILYNHDPTKGNCHSVYCPHDACPEAYLYPADNLKMKDCPADESFVITFCP